jgi:large subunit ribosomal protein L19
MNKLDKIEETQLRKNLPKFQPGDTVRVHVRIKESETKERLQAFEGVVIARKHGGARETITVRKTSFGVGVERIFPLHATIIDHIDLVKKVVLDALSCITYVSSAVKQRAFASVILAVNKPMKRRYQQQPRASEVLALWSAVTCHRFGQSADKSGALQGMTVNGDSPIAYRNRCSFNWDQAWW